MRERRSPTPGAARKRASIHDLKTALEGGRLAVHYQPLVRAADGAVAGVEALLRWKEPSAEAGVLSELIWSVERSPVIYQMENWVLQEAFAAAAAWRRSGLAAPRLNVNVSAREFPRADLEKRLRRLLSAAGLEPRDVGLEITETSSMGDLAASAEQLRALMGLGVEVWLDDFGTGHSSLEWLCRLPAHGLKIAGTFVASLGRDPRCERVVARLIDLARDLDLRVVAEGVETERQREFLVRRGCELLQGHLFHEPMPAAELEAVLAPVGLR